MLLGFAAPGDTTQKVGLGQSGRNSMKRLLAIIDCSATSCLGAAFVVRTSAVPVCTRAIAIGHADNAALRYRLCEALGL